jgi:hypothetical protein
MHLCLMPGFRLYLCDEDVCFPDAALPGGKCRQMLGPYDRCWRVFSLTTIHVYRLGERGRPQW